MPPRSSAMAAACRRVCGVTVFVFKEGHVSPARATCRVTRRWKASALSCPPRELGKTGSAGPPARSASQALRTLTTSGFKGVHRIFRPFPRQRMWAPTPSSTSWQRNEVSSLLRAPVCTATSRSARSRRPIQVWAFGADTNVVASFSVRNSTGPLSKRFAGIARMRWHCRLNAGSASETYRKKA